jgi:acyl-CoA reductase-like NAD-dependent aldehyde dehydrogenase
MSASAAPATADSRAEIAVENPATGEIAGHVADMTSDVPTLVARAREAQREWGARPVSERAELVGAMRRWLVANRQRAVESTMRETGKTYEDAVMNEVFVVASALRFWEKRSADYLKDERARARGPMVLARKFIVRRRPLGVVGAGRQLVPELQTSGKGARGRPRPLLRALESEPVR